MTTTDFGADKKVHQRRHEKLHTALDELVADFITHTKKRPSETAIIELIQWSYEQTITPTEGE